MNKITYTIQGYYSCFSWMFAATGKWILEQCPELKFWKQHNNLDDHLWYAERVNGRLAMLTLTALLLWKVTHGF